MRIALSWLMPMPSVCAAAPELPCASTCSSNVDLFLEHLYNLLQFYSICTPTLNESMSQRRLLHGVVHAVAQQPCPMHVPE